MKHLTIGDLKVLIDSGLARGTLNPNSPIWVEGNTIKPIFLDKEQDYFNTEEEHAGCVILRVDD